MLFIDTFVEVHFFLELILTFIFFVWNTVPFWQKNLNLAFFHENVAQLIIHVYGFVSISVWNVTYLDLSKHILTNKNKIKYISLCSRGSQCCCVLSLVLSAMLTLLILANTYFMFSYNQQPIDQLLQEMFHLSVDTVLHWVPMWVIAKRHTDYLCPENVP